MALLSSTTFWVGVSVFGFVALVWKPVGRMLGSGLDARAEAIEKELAEATRLREEAQATLASYQKKHKEMELESATILSDAKESVATMQADAKESLKLALAKRIEQAEERIAKEEQRAIESVQQNLVAVAMEASRTVLSDSARKAADDNLVALAADDIKNLVH